MIIIKLMGGLGNQMFQYALAKHYQLNGEKVFLDVSGYAITIQGVTPRYFELSSMPITIPLLPNTLDRFLNSKDFVWGISRKIFSRAIHQVFEKSLEFDQSYLALKGNNIISGYFQSEEYFKNFDQELRRDFSFPELSRHNLEYAQAIQGSNSISLHIRRGDYEKNKATNNTHGLLSLSYYRNAIEILNADVQHARYFIFTDDPTWAHQNADKILDTFTVVEGNLGGSSWEDMSLISLCKHNILANSSFSWWGAWLNANPNKKIIAPENWCLDKDLDFQTRHLVPPSWIRIQN